MYHLTPYNHWSLLVKSPINDNKASNVLPARANSSNNMQSTTSTPASSGKCGMCGNCNAMPPRGPESMAKLTLAERDALETRMKEAQRRFIIERDAHLTITHNGKDASIKKMDPTLDKPSESQPTSSAASATSSDDVKAVRLEERPREESSQPAQEALEETPREEFSKPAQEALEETLREQPVQEADKLDIPIISAWPALAQPSQPMLSQTLRQPSFATPSTSFGDLESDADSFHTADEDDRNTTTDSISTDFTSPLSARRSPIAPNSNSLTSRRTGTVKFSGRDQQHFEGDNSLKRSTFTGKAAENNFTGASTSTQHEFPQRPGTHGDRQGADMDSVGLTMLPMNGTSRITDNSHLDEVDLDGAFTTDNLGEANLDSDSSQAQQKRQSLVAEGEVESAHRSSVLREYGVEEESGMDKNELVSKETTRCSDCQSWRRRVQELEMKVEALTAVVAARDMVIATMRARIGDGARHSSKSEARLVEECESLRVTTEFLVSWELHIRATTTRCYILD